MPLVCLGISHHTAPVEVRERHAFPASRMSEALTALRDYEVIGEAAMLSTCGRVEIYAEVEDYETGSAQLKAFLHNFRHGSVEHDLSSYMYTLLGSAAVEHLLRVATGLDSQLIGEAEILAQVKDGYVQAQRAGSLGKILHALFREALGAGKAARSQTSIGGDSTSIATAAVELAKQRLGQLAGKTVLVVGAGKMGSLAAKRLRSEGCTALIVANRSRPKASELARGLGATEAIELTGLATALARADIVITSTGSPSFVLTTENVRAAMDARPERTMFIVDIAVPRDVDPDVAGLEGVALADIDALKGLIDTTLERRREAVPLVEEIIAEHTERFGNWYRSRTAAPIVASLYQKAEATRAAEIERLFARCPELSERERMLITGASLTIISKLFHNAVMKLRERVTNEGTEAQSLETMLGELFDLRVAALEPEQRE